MMIFFIVLVGVYSFSNFTFDEVKNVPFYTGPTPLPFKHYSGYGEVNSVAPVNKRRYLFYWFMESQNDPSNDPVILWMNGGPGCSSLEGAVNENGAFSVNDDGTEIKLNLQSWNKQANVIFLEQPAGVGYSYAMDTSDYKNCNDNRTADDVFEFLQKFFSVGFPQYKNNDFYIAGESYGGHYVTVCARRIHQAKMRNEGGDINLVGYAIGNGCTDTENEFNSWPMYWAQHALIPWSQYEQAWELCNHDFYNNRDKKECGSALDKMWDVFDEVNIYDIYDNCYGLQNTNARQYWAKTNVPDILRRLYPQKVAQRVNAKIPCVNTDNLEAYFNNDDVVSAIHAKLTQRWEECSDVVGEYYDDTWDTMIPFHQELLKNGYKVLFYSGDTDAGIDTLGTEKSIDVLMPEKKFEWNRWYVSNPTKQVGGFWKKRDNLSFITVRGAGHMVPYYKPFEIKQALDRWINDEPF